MLVLEGSLDSGLSTGGSSLDRNHWMSGKLTPEATEGGRS